MAAGLYRLPALSLHIYIISIAYSYITSIIPTFSIMSITYTGNTLHITSYITLIYTGILLHFAQLNYIGYSYIADKYMPQGDILLNEA